MDVKRCYGRCLAVAVLLSVALTLTACGREKAEPTPTIPTRTPRPTFTPTPVVEEPAGPVQPAQVEQPTEPPTPEPPTPEPPTPTPVPETVAVVTGPIVNVRRGPGTGHPLVGQVNRGTELKIVARNQAGDWWQVCCVNGEQAWIAGFLVDTLGPVDSVQVAADIPTPPPAPTPAPAPPTPTPAPAQPTPTPAPIFVFQKDKHVEPRINSNPIITFFGALCEGSCPDQAISGYKLVVEGPAGRREGAFDPNLRHGDPGLPSEFIYNAKVEISGAPTGRYRAWVADPGGKQVAEAYEYTAQGQIRTFFPRWKRR